MATVIGILIIGGAIIAAILYNRWRRAEDRKYELEEEKRKAEEERTRAEEVERRVQASLSREELEVYADDYLKLPWYGTSEKGMSTREFAEMLGIQKSQALKLLKSWQIVGKVSSRITNKGEVWWHM